MNKKNFSLAKVLLFPFVILGIISCFYALINYYGIQKLQTKYEKMYTVTVPELSFLKTLFDKLQTIQNNVYVLLNEPTKLLIDVELKKIKKDLELFTVQLKEYEQNSENELYYSTVLEYLLHFNEFLNDIEQYLLDKTRVMQEAFNNQQKIHTLQRILASNIVWKKIVQQKPELSTVFLKLSLLNSDLPLFYTMRIYQEYFVLLNSITQMKNDNTIPEIQSFLDEYQEFFNKNSSLISIFSKLESINNKKNSLVIYLNSLTKQSLSLSNTLYDERYFSAEKQNSIISDMMKYLSYFTVCIIIVLFICLVCLYKFISSSVLLPIKRITSFINQRSENSLCIATDIGVTEVRDISCAIYDFISQIEENEKNIMDSHANLEKQVEQRTDEIRKLSEKILSLAEEERYKLARELHDDIGSSIGTIKFGIEHALRLLGNSEMGNAKESLDSAIQIVKKVASQLRRIQTDLRPPFLDIGLLKTLQWYFDDFRLIHSTITLNVDLFFDDLLLTSSLQTVTFRIIQESMNNIVKHSKASIVDVQVLHDEFFEVIIKDNGVGFDIENIKQTSLGHGLRNIEERVRFSGGEFWIESSPKAGTTVVAKWVLK